MFRGIGDRSTEPLVKTSAEFPFCSWKSLSPSTGTIITFPGSSYFLLLLPHSSEFLPVPLSFSWFLLVHSVSSWFLLVPLSSSWFLDLVVFPGFSYFLLVSLGCSKFFLAVKNQSGQVPPPFALHPHKYYRLPFYWVSWYQWRSPPDWCSSHTGTTKK